jgi:hypothetical protein
MVDGGVVDPNLPVKFRGDGGELSNIDYSVMDNERKVFFSLKSGSK